jgi:CRP/FNR family transcriptional regulator, anaerobic regulatory protein
MVHDCATCPVRDHAACAALDPQERAELARLGHHRTVHKGDPVFRLGDDNIICATLLSGALKIRDIDSEGTEHIVSLIHPAGFVGELFAPISQHDVVAVADSELCVFTRAEYSAAISRYPTLATALLRRSSADLYAARALVSLIGRRSARAKVAGLLLSFSRAASGSTCRGVLHFEVPLSRSEMADLVGVTLETVSRQISQLEQQGVIERVGRRGFVVLDQPTLEALAA